MRHSGWQKASLGKGSGQQGLGGTRFGQVSECELGQSQGPGCSPSHLPFGHWAWQSGRTGAPSGHHQCHFPGLAGLDLSLSVNKEEETPGACCKGHELLNHLYFFSNKHWCQNSVPNQVEQIAKTDDDLSKQDGGHRTGCRCHRVCDCSLFQFPVYRCVANSTNLQASGTNNAPLVANFYYKTISM